MALTFRPWFHNSLSTGVSRADFICVCGDNQSNHDQITCWNAFVCLPLFVLEISGRVCNVICGLVFTLHANWSCGDVYYYYDSTGNDREMEDIRSPASNVSSGSSSPKNLKICDEHASDTEASGNAKKRETATKSPSRGHKDHSSQELHVLSNKSERRRSPAPKEKSHKKNKLPNVITTPVTQEDVPVSSVISPEISFMGGKIKVSV